MLTTTRSATSRWLLYTVVTLGFVAVITPFVWMILGSFKPEAELLRVPPTWWPEKVTLDNYRTLFGKGIFARSFFNSTLIAVVVTTANIVFCSMVGYALAKLRFRGKKLVFGLVMGTLMIPGMVTLVPLFVLVANLGLVDTYPGLMLPFLVTPFGVFLMRQFIIELPDDLLDAGRIDGASELRIFRQIILPLCGPGVATLGILTFLSTWNSFLWPLVVAQTQEHYTLPVALALFSKNQQVTPNYGLLLAGATVVVVPVLVVFLIFQRKFIEGIATTGIK
ncbi:MAG: carbohydrate ABC transporter permease [Actinomycetota bacterium]